MTHFESHREREVSGGSETWLKCSDQQWWKNHSHVSQLRLTPHQNVTNPLDLEELPLNVVHRDRWVGHGDDVLLPWETQNKTQQDQLIGSALHWNLCTFHHWNLSTFHHWAFSCYLHYASWHRIKSAHGFYPNEKQQVASCLAAISDSIQQGSSALNHDIHA